MYDTSFDHSGPEVRRSDRRILWAVRIAALIGAVAVASAGAQLPGAPVLQNVWATPGLVGAVNIAGGSDGTVYAGAAGWTPGSARFQLSGGIGYLTRKGGGSVAVYGGRVAMPFGGASSAFGFAAFAGAGGGNSTSDKTILPNGTVILDSTTSTAQFPVGAAVGYRRAFGSRGVSLYATPSYVFFTGGTDNDGLFRTAIGADIGITSSIGATLGVDFGQTRPRGFGGPTGTTYGIGVSYAFGKR